MAYNGIVPSNSPVYQKDGNPNKDAYQEKVFVKIEQDSYIDMDDDDYDLLGKFNFSPAEFNYDRVVEHEIIEFLKKEYTLNQYTSICLFL